jgi:hypothetical protein
VDAALRHLLRWPLLPRSPGHHVSHVLHRHELGCDLQGEGRLQLLRRDAEDLLSLQVDVHVDDSAHWRHDLPWLLRASRLGHLRFHRHGTHGHDHRLSLPVPVRAEPLAHGVQLLDVCRHRRLDRLVFGVSFQDYGRGKVSDRITQGHEVHICWANWRIEPCTIG